MSDKESEIIKILLEQLEKNKIELKEHINIINKATEIKNDSEFYVIHQTLAKHYDLIEENKITNGKILEQTKLTNGRVTKLETIESNHEVSCPQKDRIKRVEEQQLKTKSVQTFLIKFVGIISVIGGIIYTFIKIFEP